MERILPRRDRRTPDDLRWLYGIGGAALVLWGLKRRSWLGVLISSAGADLLNWSCTGHYLHETLDVTTLTRKGVRALVPHQLGIRVDRSIAVYRPIDAVYQFFRDFKNLARFLSHVNDIREVDEKHSHSGLVKGRTLTSYHTIQDDLANAGAKWVDSEAVVDRNWVSSKQPGDIPKFNEKMRSFSGEGLGSSLA